MHRAERNLGLPYLDPAGRQRNKTFKRKAEAERYSRAVDTDISRGDWIDPRLAKTTVGEYADRWFSTIGNKPKTVQGYAGCLRNWVIPELGDLPVAAEHDDGEGVRRAH